MASVFTYETEPVHLSSPWPEPSGARGGDIDSSYEDLRMLADLPLPAIERLDCVRINKLEAEPQEGPTEYKLHLLLRPRRTFSATSTISNVGGSHMSKTKLSHLSHTRKIKGSDSQSGSSIPLQQVAKDIARTSSPAPSLSTQSRQTRLQHLTTQLLWRLQQSSPHHSSSRSQLVLPVLPTVDNGVRPSQAPDIAVAGLEESLGALYEIGVSDDGSLVGLTLDEMQESLCVLKAMSSSLGCGLQLMRMIMVGECQWEEEALASAPNPGTPTMCHDHLWVVEVLVKPQTGDNYTVAGGLPSFQSAEFKAFGTVIEEDTPRREPVEQLRISLTGSTTSGKSSFLGTLSTSTLDNGRGKSRLSLLKHRHEIVSGVTSSLAQELLGYRDGESAERKFTSIINYASGNVSSWTDIHNTADPGRLVFLTDSAGHPKFRRTTVRALMSWAPHWTLCCIAADENHLGANKLNLTTPAQVNIGQAAHQGDTSSGHLELCLKLGLPLVVVITKLDLATKTGLRGLLTRLLSMLKEAGRRPLMLPQIGLEKVDLIEEMIATKAETMTYQALRAIEADQRHLTVPIVLASAVTGDGIDQIHALLRHLPIKMTNHIHELELVDVAEQLPSTIFHVDEVSTPSKPQKTMTDHGPRHILSGYIQTGCIESGSILLLGPLATLSHHPEIRVPLLNEQNTFHHRLSKSLPKDIHSLHVASHAGLPRTPFAATPAVSKGGVWQSVRIVSIRYLRLPVRTLLAGQVGTIAIELLEHDVCSSVPPLLRRGMVLIAAPQNIPAPSYASSRISAVFSNPDIYVNPGSSVTLYTASIRTLARIVEVKLCHAGADDDETNDTILSFDQDEENGESTKARLEITFQFSTSQEFIQLGTKVLVTPASGISMLAVNTISTSPQELNGHGGWGTQAPSACLDSFVGEIVGKS